MILTLHRAEKNPVSRLFGLILFFAFFLTASLHAQNATRGTLPEPIAQTTSTANGKYYALVIGINAYPAPLPSLKTAEHDAQSIAKTLQDDYSFDVKILLGHDASRNNILAAVNRFEDTLQPNDNLVIYYAGHGYENKTNGKAYWLPVDADSNSSPNRIISDDITSEMAAIPARHILLISDSCYSGGLTRDTDVIPQSHGQEAFLQKMLDGRSRTLMASGGDEPVADSGKDGHSAFAYAVLQALSKTSQPLFTASDLFYDGTGGVQRRVSGNTQQVPQYAVIRNSSHDEGDFVFTRKNASSAEIAAKLSALGPAYNRGAALFDAKHYFAALPLLASACEANSFRACSYLGLMYLDGNGVPKNFTRAMSLFNRACENGDGKGCNNIAIQYYDGQNVPKDLPAAIKYWGRACDGNYALSCSSLGALYSFSDQPHDFTRAAELFNKNCDEISQNGCRGRGVMYEKGMGTAPDLAQAMVLYRKGCDLGDQGSCLKVGLLSIAKHPPDYVTATAGYRKACDLGAANGCDLLGYMYLQGQGLAADKLEAATLYGQGCDTDKAAGCASLGLAYKFGWGVAVDMVQATFIFRTGCDAGDVESCQNLALLYEYGQGVPQDYAQAFALYRKGCDAKDSGSCTSLATLYALGKGIAEDYAKALTLFRGACDDDFGKACSYLGLMYENGMGVTADKAQAVKLYRKACDGGDTSACANLKRIEP